MIGRIKEERYQITRQCGGAVHGVSSLCDAATENEMLWSTGTESRGERSILN